MSHRILAIEDDETVLKLYRFQLESEGYKVSSKLDGESGLLAAKKEKPDAIILDVKLPDMDGFEICASLKSNSETAGIPVIMVTAKVRMDDRLKGLEFGADEYLSKPYDPRELILRIKNILKRSSSAPAADEVFRSGNLTVNLKMRECRVDDKPARLTFTEFNLLEALVREQGVMISREKLFKEVLKVHEETHSRSLDTHIHNLRAKLKSAGSRIETVRNRGYRFR